MLAILSVVACGTTSTSPNAGSVTVLATWSGPEQASLDAVLKPFTAQTGIKVDYTSTQDEAAVLKTSVAAGHPPDLVATLNPQLLRQFAQQGKVVPLNGVVDMTALQSNYAKSWLDLGEPLNDGKLYEVYTSVSMKGLVSYDTKMFQSQSYNVPTTWQGLLDLQNQIQASGTTPWCLGLHSGGADEGWPASDWLEEIVLGQSGPGVYDKWVAGTQKWSSPEITLAFETFAAILGSGDGDVYGGKSQALSTSFKTAGDPLFTNPP